ncbi:substrate-binding domain-containing protein [Pyrinomonas methylaliphatogenes]|uniref:Autoinducer 2 import system permease protein LsrD n=1 Tax=Pyrinomonas methylaliphatogenes TaxID=454194 RepID=A0A0B6WV90_9BACT|nr:substrate-binding domain-containing protein [Pyrinomonas methylaliphatogenes]CDM64179.1 monosaccharide ABC transporter substrate-binding protein, CUT2 family (TC 3.A.1.2.-)/monosaccharide ABC transporter membrane protein, CUT2 family [Pyrinomonas methylaliphatogenes]
MPIKTEGSWRARLFPNNEWALVLVIAVECAIFGATGRNFLTAANGFEVARLGVELGLIAFALTPIIITGGIDLSVGSMMALAAVVLGGLWRDGHWPLPAAVLAALGVGLAGGGLNALLIARFRFPPLIVTLGTFSLFRGIAEGLTRGIENYSGFDPRFLFWGQGYVGGLIPTQLFVLVSVFLFYAHLVHRTAFGRSLRAIGFSAEGARYAGIRVARQLACLYVLSGFVSALAAIIYVAHLGQAKSDAGTGYELMAITSVVIGGTSIFGGHGTIWGTALGLFAIVILQNGLRLSGQPAELAGVLTGALLIATILIDRVVRRPKAPQVAQMNAEENTEVRNSQIAVLSIVILLAALIVAGSNWFLINSLRRELRSATGERATAGPAAHRTVIAMMPKAKGDPYFISCKQGADEAARELGVELLWDGPTELDPAKQNEVVEAWITRGVDAIAVSVENRVGISTVLRKARERGIKVLTWDADAERDARDFFVNQATPQGIGYTLTDEAARILGGRGEFAIITASLSAANQNEWIKYIKERLAQKYPDLKLVAIQPSEGDRDRAFAETQTVLKVYPNVRLIMAIAAPAVPGAAEAVKQAGRRDVKVIGLSLPSMCRTYIHEGIIESIVLWNTRDLGYLTVYAAQAAATGRLKRGDRQLEAGRLGRVEVADDEVRLGAPFIFNRENIDRFDF